MRTGPGHEIERTNVGGRDVAVQRWTAQFRVIASFISLFTLMLIRTVHVPWLERRVVDSQGPPDGGTAGLAGCFLLTRSGLPHLLTMPS